MARKLWLVVAGGLVVVGLGALLLFTQDRGTEPSRPQPSIAPSPDLAAVLRELSGFVEQVRGLRFRDEVKITVLSAPLFEEALAKMSVVDPLATTRAQTVLRVFGLLPPGADLAALLVAADQRTVGFYDPMAKELLIRGGEPTPSLRRALVHELTHALDDQHFGLDRQIPGEEAAAAFEALFEGSAIRVEQIYVGSLPAAEQEAIQSEEEAQLAAAPQLPPAVEQLIGFPYVYGPAFVDALVRARGPGGIDQAFSSPPLNSEQVLDPARYLSGDAPRTVKAPFAEGSVIDEGEIGPVLLRLLLETKLEPAAAQRAVTGWGGDRYVVWVSPDGRSCVRTLFVMDSPEDSSQLEAALAMWVDRVTDREVASAGTLLKVCEPRR